MIKLTQNDWRIFRRLQRKHKVSTEFLRYNLENIEKFIWFETWPRIVIRRYAVRRGNRVFIIYYRLRRVLFDQSNSKMFKRMRQNMKQWSKRVVVWQKKHLGINEYIEEVLYDDKCKDKDCISKNMETSCGTNEDVSKQLKEQLELLKNGRRPQSLITKSNFQETDLSGSHEEKQKSDSSSVGDSRNIIEEKLNNIKSGRDKTTTLDTMRSQELSVIENPFVETTSGEIQMDWQTNLESTPEKQITNQENIKPVKQLDTDEKTEKSHSEPTIQQTEKLKTGLNFLDMLMCKVSGSTATSSTNVKKNLQRIESSICSKEAYQHHHEHSMDSTDEFLGFDDCDRIPGMLMTPIVPHSTRNNKNSAFVSESLNEYMRLNDLETSYSIDEDKSVTKGKIFARDMEGLMTPKTKPPHFDMPAVPENLLKFRTVAERKQYLQKFSRNCRLAIINNEASIYRELQRRMRTQKVKSGSQHLTQSANSSMSFTRNGWKAASFLNTEFNKYYYQILDVDRGTCKVRLRGARGNNDDFNKIQYVSRLVKTPKGCSECCADAKVWQYLKPIKTIAEKTKKLNRGPFSSVFKPCPLSHKTFQKPLDDDTAALLLAGGSMAVVRMPTVELEVFPEYGKPLHEIAKRYLQYILPHHDISREWAEFSVSTLQQSETLKEAEQATAKSFSTDPRKSYTFVIPYLNDRNHILVRRVVDRSEKLDESFEHCIEDRELGPKTDFSFRKYLDLSDDVLLTCADIVSDMINTVAISCSENSFIKNDPDGLNIDEFVKNKLVCNSKPDVIERPILSSPNATVVSGGIFKKQKKQNSLLMELKRLNATIIDAAVKPENDKKPCARDYCQMGCICVSLEDSAPIREHCGKTKCMLDCTCKPSNQSRIMRLETDGRTLTTEDAFMLRRKATARLARMEKEFTSTIVLTGNETLLINETNNDKKRRCTKVPKRYEDFTDTEDEQRRNSPKKAALTNIDKEKHLGIEIKELHEPVYVKDSILEQLKHCTVNLVPLQDMDNIAHWCMVHNLYKCFCKGLAIEGKPMVIEKEEANTTVEHDSEQKMEFGYNVNAKARYTFDKVEKKKNGLNNNGEDEESGNDNETEDFDEEEQDEKDDDDDWIKERKRIKHKEAREISAQKLVDQSNSQTDEDCEEDEYAKGYAVKLDRTEKQRPKRSLRDVRQRFYMPRLDSCRRHIPTPRRMFLYCNRRRRLSVLKYIKDNENDQTRLLLNEHVMRSVYYHKIDVENHKRIKNTSSNSTERNCNRVKKSNSVVSQPPQSAESLPKTDLAKKSFLLVNEIVDLLEDEDEVVASKITNKNKNNDNKMDSSTSTKSFEKLSPDTESSQSTNHFQICSSGGVITVKKCTSKTDFKNADKVKSQPAPMTTADAKKSADVKKVTETDSGVNELKLPKISSCFSLNVKANLQNNNSIASLNEEQCLDFTSATSVNSAAFLQNQNQQIKNSPKPTPAGTTTASKDTDNTLILNMDNENVRDVYNNVIKTMNTLVSKKMQDIDCALKRESHIIPTPNADILCIMKWCNFLDAFCEGFAYIWQVKMKDSTFFVVTIKNVMPLIIGAMGIVHIAALKAEKMPLLGRMLFHKFRNKETEKLAVVMQGKQSHWVVKGFLKADPNTACNKPTPESHPSLTKKINILCSLLVKQRQKEQKKKEKLASQWSGTQVNSVPKSTTASIQGPSQLPLQAPQSQAPKIAQIMPTRRIITIQPRTVPQKQNPPEVVQLQPPAATQPLTPQITQQKDNDVTQQSIKQNETAQAKVGAKISSRKRKADSAQCPSFFKMDSYSKMSSNIEFRSVTQGDIDEIFLPELHKLDHKWLVLDLHNDFSHIFVPDFRDLVSLDRIQKVINFARQKSKIVKLQFFQNAPFDAFVTPKSVRKIYFGPLTMNMNAPTLMLLQSVDGQMMLRELYQLQHNIVKKPEEKTKAFWLVHLKGQTHFEMDLSVINEKSMAEKVLSNNASEVPNKTMIETVTTESLIKTINENEGKIFGNDDDDEDCIIIEEPLENSNMKDTITNTSLQSNPMSALLPMQSSMPPLSNNVGTPILPLDSQSLIKVPNTTTIIKPLNSSNTSRSVVINVPSMAATKQPLPILTLPSNTIITGITPPTPTTKVGATQMVTLPQTAIITGIESAPPEAPYSSTIFITSSSSAASVVATTTTSTATVGSAPVTSTSLGNIRIHANELRSACIKQQLNTIRPALDAGAIKRRRISLFCSNKYDQISENLAVDAVIRKILPDNTAGIQINQLNDKNNVSSVNPEVVGTVESTQISKVIPHTDSNILKTTLESSINTEVTKCKAPIVFDVNFMDDGDEPTASIVIKPTSSTAISSTTTSSAPKSFISRITTSTTTSLLNAPVTSACLSTNLTTETDNENLAAPHKKIKLHTIPNTTPAASSASTSFVTGKTKIINSFLCTKQTNIAPTFSTPKPITSQLVSSSSISLSTAETSTIKPFPFRRPPVSLNLQKVVTSTVATTLHTVKPITTNATATKNQPLAPSTTLTVKQVQDMLNKPVRNSATPNPVVIPSAIIPLHKLPAIKATITPANLAAISATSTKIPPPSSVTVSSSCEVTSTFTLNNSPVTTTLSETTSLNPTLTISKVQSFGSPQKTHSPEKNLQTFTPPAAKVVNNDLNDKAPIQRPTPPAHIQYGYIVSASHENQKFVAKRVADEFYVKVPSVGILKLQGLGAVNNYLNKFINKISKEAQTTPAVWQFVAASKAVQMQNHQKSLLVRKTKNTSCCTGTSGNKDKYPNNSFEEPILIDD